MSYSQDLFVRLSGTTPGTFSGHIANTSGASSCPIYASGNVVTPLDLIVERLGPNTTAAVDSNQPGWTQLLEFRAHTLTVPWTVASMTFSASGTAIADAAFSYLGLFEDSATAGTPGVFDGPAIDTPAGPFATAFLSGSATIALNDPAFPATATRGFFLCGELAGNATAGRTLAVDLTAMNASPSGTGAATIRGMPTVGNAPALQINPARLSFVVNGPEAYTTVLRDSQGPADNGHVICDLSTTSVNYDWTVTSITFAESGTIDAQHGLSFLRLYVDNGNGIWDGPQTDLVAANGTATGFSAPNGEYKAALMPAFTHLGVNQTRRFFLVAKLSGGATPAQTLRVAVIDVDQSSPTQGEVQGVPSATVPALVVELSTLSISVGPGNPQSFSTLKDSGGRFAIGQFRLTASAGSFTLHGLHLTTGGNGNWVSNIASVEICLDDGDGEFGSGDVILSSDAPTSAGVDCQFFQGLNLAQGTLSDVWVVVTPNPSAGGTPSETFSASVVFESDVAVTPASAFIAQGAHRPVTGTLHVVDFAVASFTPSESGLNGGASIMIRGSGFADPVKLTIGGALCGGTAIVNASGTEIRGLKVPKGTGQDLEIVLQTNGLDPIVLGQTFTYSAIYEVEDKKGEGQGCTVGASAAPLAALLPGVLGMLALRRRRHS
jgi:hypothetical protein